MSYYITPTIPVSLLASYHVIASETEWANSSEIFFHGHIWNFNLQKKSLKLILGLCEMTTKKVFARPEWYYVENTDSTRPGHDARKINICIHFLLKRVHKHQSSFC